MNKKVANLMDGILYYGIGVRARMKSSRHCRAMKEDQRGEFGINLVITIAAGLIVAAFVLIPGVKDLASTMISEMKTWWTTTVKSTVFPTSSS